MSLITKDYDPPRQQAALPAAPLSLEELERRLRAVEPAALLALPRIVRRVIKYDRDLTGLGLKVPHRKTFVVSRQRLLEIVEPGELNLPASAELPETVILIARPEEELLGSLPPEALLLRTWRLLFHARIHVALDACIAAGRLSTADLRRRIERIGPTTFAEIRAVLRQEDFLLPPRDDLSVYTEFAAVYCELRHFAPSLLPRYFPAIEDQVAIDEVLVQDVDADTLFHETRLQGAPDPVDRTGPLEDDDAVAAAQPALTAPHRTAETQARKLLRRADKVAALGNVVRSAMLRLRAANLAGPELAAQCRAAAQADLDRLVERLQEALELRDRDPQPWRDSLLALTAQTGRGLWTAEARLLYDLQKVCVDHEREIYTVDLIEWALSRGRLPIQRPLPSQREVLMSKHLRSATGRLAAVRISEELRRQLGKLLETAAVRAEEQLRDSFRPRLDAALDDVGLLPKNLPERVARKKLIEELLDRIVERGFLTMGDLRDALSRNNLKLPDIADPQDFVRGDQLLRIDRQLADSLDGVYERGAIYLRGMQQLSSVAFGTRTGRFITQYVALPFGGAYVILAGVQHLVDLIHEHFFLKLPEETAIAAVHEQAQHAVHQVLEAVPIKTNLSIFLLGVLLLGLLHVGWFRRGVTWGLRKAGRGIKAVFYDGPLWLARQPLVQAVVRSRPFVLGFRFVVKPLLFTAVVGAFFPLRSISVPTLGGSAAAMFLTMNLLLNSPLGRQVQEVLSDWLVQTWHRIGLRIITGMFYLVMDAFKSVLETIERLLYTVDEWLRFKSGESQVALGIKAVLGVVWFAVTYLIRFCVNLLIEPQINPIKHFPVVTVSHKLLLPLIPVLAGILNVTLDEALALTVATVVITSIPGIFGFLVWELKENWRLYDANRPRRLRPVPIGHHNETLARLLKPGFHSGTVPKLFAKLRRAERKARQRGNWKATRKHLQALHHVELRIRRYVEREFIELLAESRHWGASRVSVGRVHLASNRVLVELRWTDIDDTALWIALDQQAGWLRAEIARPGWFDRLSPQQRRVLNTALVGLYHTGGVDLVSEQIEACFTPLRPPHNLVEQGLVVWPQRDYQTEVLYDLHGGPMVVPHTVTGSTWRALPTLPRSQLVFGQNPISWRRWVQTWRQDETGEGHPRDLMATVCVVPGEQSVECGVRNSEFGVESPD